MTDRPRFRRRWKIYQEEAKLRHTSHWDMDYMSREQIEALYGHDPASPDTGAEPAPPVGSANRSLNRWFVAGLGVLLLTATVILAL